MSVSALYDPVEHPRPSDLREEWVDIWHNHGRHADVARKHYDRAEYIRAKQKVADAIDKIVEKVTGSDP